MFSGKTEELIRRLRRHQIAGRKVIAFKPVIDDRYTTEKISSHNGVQFDCLTVSHPFELTKLSKGYDVIGLDEAQFFGYEIQEAVTILVEQKGMTVIMAGLDMTFRKQPWPSFPWLFAVADKIDKLTAVCSVCGEDAVFTQRLVDNEPASFEGDTIIVGGTDRYEARCRDCFQEG